MLVSTQNLPPDSGKDFVEVSKEIARVNAGLEINFFLNMPSGQVWS